MNKLAQINFGQVKLPAALQNKFGGDVIADNPIGRLINLLMMVMVVTAGIYAVFNFILAGYAFLSAGDDSKKVAGAWAKIWQTFLGLAVAAGDGGLPKLFEFRKCQRPLA